MATPSASSLFCFGLVLSMAACVPLHAQQQTAKPRPEETEAFAYCLWR